MKKTKKFILFFLFMVVNMNLKSENLIINYQRINNDYDGWKLWIWDRTENKEGFEIYPQTQTDFGLKFILDLERHNLKNKEIGILPKYGNWENKESFDRIFKHNGESEVYIIEGDTNVYKSIKEIETSTRTLSALYDGNGIIRVIFSRRIITKNLDEFYLLNLSKGEKEIISPSDNLRLSNYVKFKTYDLPLEEIRKGNYKVISNYGENILEMGKAIEHLKVENDEYGQIDKENSILLRVFSTAKELNLILKNNDKELKLPVNYKGNFNWEIELPQDYYGYLYKYEAIYPQKTVYGIDPYARLTYDNNKWAVLYKNDSIPIAPSPIFDLSQTIIYEMSIRDFTIDSFSGVKDKGKYTGISEEKTTHPNYKDITTGISHLKELGINAVHIMPFFDFEKDENTTNYDWGYMPVSFNSPDGWFAVDKMKKIEETKKMIDALHRNGIKVIMDVVYNHTAETRDKIYNFNALASDYYYRTREDNTYYNGSGCGNEFKSDSPYGRKFIIDSLKYWVNEYKIDGFRFDLMGLIDLETVDEIVKELKKINPEIIIYGEPWKAGESYVKGVSKGEQKNRGFAVFNDDIRDAIKGSVFNVKDLGYVQNGNYREKVKKGIKGSIETFTSSPLETINYVSCHDNHTLFDRLRLSLPDEEISKIIKRDKLAQSIVFISQGIAFLHSGEEFLRTKKGNENSYNAPDEINRIDWTRKKEFYDVFSYYRDLIKLRKEHPVFRMKTRRDVEERIKFYEDLNIPLPDQKSIAFLIDGEGTGDVWKRIIVILNPNDEQKEFKLPDGVWEITFDENGFKDKFIEARRSVIVKPISMMVLKSK